MTIPVKVEHRLTLFYLANDVIQYSKRKNYEFVESWGTALQRATTMVRLVSLFHAFQIVVGLLLKHSYPFKFLQGRKS